MSCNIIIFVSCHTVFIFWISLCFLCKLWCIYFSIFPVIFFCVCMFYLIRLNQNYVLIDVIF
uniref:Uncharacterized protein n=1 Tax=Papilio xuthus TaxID=66420 RepID=I4DLM7_PAPXU|nr:unknown unsecreted protein [Papilio xuthus]